MTNEQQKAKELAELLNAFADGKQLEWDSYAGFVNMKYDDLKQLTDIFNSGRPIRIKPEPKRVPLNQQDMIDRIKEGKTMWVKYEQFDIKYWQIAGFDLYSVFFAFDEIDYDLLSEFGTFLDDAPCYKEVEDE